MRTRHLPTVLALAAIAATLPRADAPAAPPAIEGVQVEFADPLIDARAASVQRTAVTATNYLGQKLVAEINVALRKGTLEEAIAAVHLRSMSADGQAVPGMPKIKAFKLTSLRLINAANAPDYAEQQVLDEISRLTRSATKPPDLLVQHIALPDGTEEWRGYRPLAVLPLCLACHGPSEGKPPGVRALLAQRAGSTPAVGYKAGEWRGLMRVTIEAPPKA